MRAVMPVCKHSTTAECIGKVMSVTYIKDTLRSVIPVV